MPEVSAAEDKRKVGQGKGQISTMDTKRGESLCEISNINQNCTIYAFSIYDGDTISTEKFISDDHQTIIQDIKINKPDECVVFFISAYEPTVWKIYKTPETNLIAVVAGGHYPQMISGIDENVQTAIHISEDKSEKCLNSAC